MKVEDIVKIYQKKNQLENALVLKVLDSIKDFGRKLTLRSQYKPIKDIAEGYEEERMKVAKDLIAKYCKLKNAENKDNKDWNTLKPDTLQTVPQEYMPKFTDKNKSLLEAEVDIKVPMKFTLKEIKDSGIVFSEIEAMEDFIDFNTNPNDGKSAKNKKVIAKK